MLGTLRLFSMLILSVADFFSRNQRSNFIYSDVSHGFTVREKNRPMINEFTAKIFSCFTLELSINVQNNCICVSYFSVGKLFFCSMILEGDSGFGISLIKRYPTHKPMVAVLTLNSS